jgi:hypothetical protein
MVSPPEVISLPRRRATVPAMTETESGGFAAFDLVPSLRAALAALGYAAPTEIQRRALPALLDGRPVVGVAETGGGKPLRLRAPDPAPAELAGGRQRPRDRRRAPAGRGDRAHAGSRRPGEQGLQPVHAQHPAARAPGPWRHPHGRRAAQRRSARRSTLNDQRETSDCRPSTTLHRRQCLLSIRALLGGPGEPTRQPSRHECHE